MEEEKKLEAVKSEIKKVKELLLGAQYFLAKKHPKLMGNDEKRETLFLPWVRWNRHSDKGPDDIKICEEKLAGLKDVLDKTIKKLSVSGVPVGEADLRQYYIKRQADLNDEVGRERFQKSREPYKGVSMN